MKSISIVTPTRNQVGTIAQTMESVLSQECESEVEYIIVDACSDDGTKEVVEGFVEKFKSSGKKLLYVREPDDGQSDAINKGWRQCTGEVVGYINSDDYFEPGAFAAVEKYFSAHLSMDWAYGGWRLVNSNGVVYKTKSHKRYTRARLLNYCDIGQPSCFFKRKLLEEVGFLNTNHHLAMDYDLWLRIAQKSDAGIIPDVLSCMRYYVGAKSADFSAKQAIEVFKLGASYTHPLSFRRFAQLFYIARALVVIRLNLDITRRIENA